MMIRLDRSTGAWWGCGYRTEAVVSPLCESISSKQSSLRVGFPVLLLHPIANRMLIGPFWCRPSAVICSCQSWWLQQPCVEQKMLFHCPAADFPAHTCFLLPLLPRFLRLRKDKQMTRSGLSNYCAVMNHTIIFWTWELPWSRQRVAFISG